MISSAIIPQPLARLPWRLIFLVSGIGIFGLINLYSAAGGSIAPWALRQGMAFGVFLVVAVIISNIRETTIKSLTIPGYIAIVVMLILVDILGFVGKGAQRWLDLGFIRLQPSEFMKPAIALMCARFYDLLPTGEIRKFRAIWPAAALIVVPTGLVILQPDLGTGLMVLFAGVTVMFLAGVPLRWFLIPGGLAAASIPKVIRWAAATTSRKARSRSARAECSARAFSRAARAICSICPRATPILPSPLWPRNGECSAGRW